MLGQIFSDDVWLYAVFVVYNVHLAKTNTIWFNSRVMKVIMSVFVETVLERCYFNYMIILEAVVYAAVVLYWEMFLIFSLTYLYQWREN